MILPWTTLPEGWGLARGEFSLWEAVTKDDDVEQYLRGRTGAEMCRITARGMKKYDGVGKDHRLHECWYIVVNSERISGTQQ